MRMDKLTNQLQMALADARKAVAMFRQGPINVPVLGVVENMAWFTPKELPDNKYYIFGEGGGEKIAQMYDVPMLGQIPLVQGIREGGDSGMPIVMDENAIPRAAFMDLAEKVAQQVAIRNATLEPTQKVTMQG